MLSVCQRHVTDNQAVVVLTYTLWYFCATKGEAGTGGMSQGDPPSLQGGGRSEGHSSVGGCNGEDLFTERDDNRWTVRIEIS